MKFPMTLRNLGRPASRSLGVSSNLLSEYSNTMSRISADIASTFIELMEGCVVLVAMMAGLSCNMGAIAKVGADGQEWYRCNDRKDRAGTE
jgi:hypothetical protein